LTIRNEPAGQGREHRFMASVHSDWQVHQTKEATMKRSIITSAIVAASLGLAGLPALAQTSPEVVDPLEPQPVPSTVVGPTLDQEPRERLSALEGMTVTDTRGQEIGDVSRLVEGVRDQLPYAVLSIGGFLGMGDTEVAIPLRNLRRAGDDLELTSGATREQLERQAGEFHSENYREIDFGARD
jgi:sporulation protein YlmC with PRC-barrel domain